MPHTYQPFAATPAISELGNQLKAGQPFSQKIGMLLIARALSRRGWGRIFFLLAGGALCWRAYQSRRRTWR